jgi:hypothetical protein
MGADVAAEVGVFGLADAVGIALPTWGDAVSAALVLGRAEGVAERAGSVAPVFGAEVGAVPKVAMAGAGIVLEGLAAVVAGTDRACRAGSEPVTTGSATASAGLLDTFALPEPSSIPDGRLWIALVAAGFCSSPIVDAIATASSA